MNVGLIVANLPACRPILDSFISHISSSRGTSRDRTYGVSTRSGSGGKTLDRYLELQESGNNTDLETRIYSRQQGDTSSYVDVDNDSQKEMIGGRKQSEPALRVQVKRDITVVSDAL